MGVHDQLQDFIKHHTEESERDDFHLFEPWDVEERPAWMHELAMKDGVNLRSDEMRKLLGSDPHPFQLGLMTSKAVVAIALAGNRVGKSAAAIIDIIIKATGELPYCFRYDKGVKTPVKREVSEDNIKRWGRFDAETEEFLDHDTTVKPDDTWDCGYIMGVGHYPKELIIPQTAKEKTVWVCTKKQAWESMWFKKFQDLVPKYMLDTSRGQGGFDNRNRLVYFNGGVEVKGLTYDQGAPSFEAVEVPYCFMDEEAPQAVYAAAFYHCTKMRIFETPYKGVTWTYSDLLIPSAEEGSGIEVYHATQFDSPYVDKEWILARHGTVKPWERKARIWGLHSDAVGRPYYEEHLELLDKWAINHMDVSFKADFIPTKQYHSMRDLPDIEINRVAYKGEHERGEWNIYEDVKPNTAYWLSADTAEGSEEDSQAAADRNAGFIFREPYANENQLYPVCVAACRSTRGTLEFARSCAHAATYYNCALLAPEVRGETSAVFATEVREYPFLYRMTVISNKTNRPTKKVGFITSPRTRPIIFSNLTDLLNEYAESPEPPFTYLPLIQELKGCIVVKGGKPDHPKNGTTDSIVAYGVGIYVYQIDRGQIRDNSRIRAKTSAETSSWYADRLGKPKDESKAVFKRRR